VAALGPEHEEAAALLALAGIPGLGLPALRRLVDRFESGTAALARLRGAPPAVLVEAAGPSVRVGPRTAPALRALSADGTVARLERARLLGLRIVSWASTDYPAPLLDLVAPPPVLFLRGREWPDFEVCVAIVGTRRSTPYGRAVAHRLARDFARWGWTVVSGMARGIDAAAHAGALDAGGHTIGVLGSGHEHEYPAANRDLYRRMRRGGLLVSEFWPSERPGRHTFPRRNRIIGALGRAVVVVEAGERSGALNTAALATEIGKEVLAVPGRIDAPSAQGVLGLLRRGAGVVAGVRDVFDAVGWVHDYEPPAESGTPGSMRPPPRAGRVEDARVLRALCGQGLTADETAAQTGLDVGRTLAALGRLEVDGRVARGPGGRFEIVSTREPV